MEQILILLHYSNYLLSNMNKIEYEATIINKNIKLIASEYSIK